MSGKKKPLDLSAKTLSDPYFYATPPEPLLKLQRLVVITMYKDEVGSKIPEVIAAHLSILKTAAEKEWESIKQDIISKSNELQQLSPGQNVLVILNELAPLNQKLKKQDQIVKKLRDDLAVLKDFVEEPEAEPQQPEN